MNVLTLLVIVAALIAGLAFVWRCLPDSARSPVAVYIGSYVLTYCIGGVWIGLTDGNILGSYFRDRLYIPSVFELGPAFWIVLLSPLILPVCVAAILLRHRQRPAVHEPSLTPSVGQFAVVFTLLAGYAVLRIFQSGAGVLQALTNLTVFYGDTTTIIEHRLGLFGPGTTIAFGIIYSALPALSHVAVFKMSHGRKWRAIAFTAIGVTLALSLATLQVAPAAVFIGALVVSASHLGLVRMSWVRAAVFGTAFLFLLQAMNGWKFAEWTFVENLRHVVFRMPSAFPYYLDCFPGTVYFLGTDWIGALTGMGADPGAPFVVARFMYPDTLAAGAMAAPAHVQAYAEGGVLNAIVAVLFSGVLIAGVSLLYKRSHEGALWHALYLQGLVTLYYATQTSFRGLLWHSYGICWAAAALVMVGALSLRPLGTRLGENRTGTFAPLRVPTRAAVGRSRAEFAPHLTPASE